jgi:hypothetical protein
MRKVNAANGAGFSRLEVGRSIGCEAGNEAGNGAESQLVSTARRAIGRHFSSDLGLKGIGIAVATAAGWMLEW